MSIYVLRRLLVGLLTLLLASAVIFAVLELLPGDPALLMLGMNATPDVLENLRREMGLDQPVLLRYLSWLSGMATGDFGRSYTYGAPVIDLIAERAGVSVPLALISLAITAGIAIPVGILAAARRGGPADTAVIGATQFGMAVPNFWFALLLVYVFAVWLRLLPSGGFPGWGGGVLPGLKALVLPAIALALPQAAILARVTRSAMLDVMGEDYIRTARAKGLPRRRVLWRHALRNALVPVVTIMGLQFAFLLAGTIIIENVFYLPGLGRLAYQAITQRDLIVVEGVVMLLVASVIFVNLAVDLLYAVIDPRIRTA